MGFIAPKIVQYLLLPPASILLIMLGGLLLLRRHREAGRALVAIGMVLLYLLSLPLAADMLIRPLETAFPPLADPPRRAAAVVVLGNGVRDLSWVPAGPEPSETSVERLAKGIELARDLHTPLILSGGSGEIADHGVREADAMAALAERLGIPRKDIIIENASRNTQENARETRKLVAGRTIILVTSAFHLKRSAAMFAAQGFEVIPAPVGYRSQTRPVSASNLLPHASNLSTSSIALAEHLSIAWYTMTGAI
jgi:uncharacterized SAM-binding protein YcdF (DUF218 family)